jgi:hypothetical protein
VLSGHFPGKHHVHAGDLPSFTSVDRLDPRVGQGATEDLHVDHTGQLEVIGVVALTAEEAVVLNPLAA